MKKFLFLFLLLSNFCSAQYTIPFPYQAKYSSAPKQAKINFTDVGDSGITGWTAYNWTTGAVFPSPPIIPLGTTGWSITFNDTGTNGGSAINGTFTFGDSTFPDAILNSFWYSFSADPFDFIISGLNPAKTYTIQCATADSEGPGDGISTWTFGSTTQTMAAEPNNNIQKLTFTSIAPDGSGNMAMKVVNLTSGATILNSIIITENFFWLLLIPYRRRRNKLTIIKNALYNFLQPFRFVAVMVILIAYWWVGNEGL